MTEVEQIRIPALLFKLQTDGVGQEDLEFLQRYGFVMVTGRTKIKIRLSNKGVLMLLKIMEANEGKREGVKRVMWIYCDKRGQRIATDVCRYKKCKHLKADRCKFKPRTLRLLEQKRKEKKHESNKQGYDSGWTADYPGRQDVFSY